MKNGDLKNRSCSHEG